MFSLVYKLTVNISFRLSGGMQSFDLIIISKCGVDLFLECSKVQTKLKVGYYFVIFKENHFLKDKI